VEEAALKCSECGADEGTCGCAASAGELGGEDQAMLVEFLKAMNTGPGTAATGAPAGALTATAESHVAVGTLDQPAAPSWAAPGPPRLDDWAPPGHAAPGAYPPPPYGHGQVIPSFAPPPRRLSPGARLGVILGSVLGGIFILGVMLAIAIPTFLSVQRGTTWFNNGVPDNWVPATVSNLPAGADVVAAWRVPGPDVDGVFPCVAVVEFGGFNTTTVPLGQWLESVSAQAQARGLHPQDITLTDGAQAIEIQAQASGFDNAQLAGQAVTSSYSIYAQHGDNYYLVEFVADASNFPHEVRGTAPVLANFIGTNA